jgi:hypothetical protein
VSGAPIRAAANARERDDLFKLSKLLFGSKKAPTTVLGPSTTSAAEADDLVRQQLAAHGDDGSAPRHTLFYFYGGELAGLRAAAEAANYFVRPTQAADGLVLEKAMPVDEASFRPVDERMQAWAATFNSEYDGWEAAVAGK